jgi:hypothetical protein
MDKFVCRRCNYDTPYKCAYIKHLERKIPCNSINEDVSIEELLRLVKKEVIITNYSCEYCGKYFNQSQGKYQHKQRCKRKPKGVEERLLELQEKINDLENKTIYQKQNIITPPSTQQTTQQSKQPTEQRKENFYQNILEEVFDCSHKRVPFGVTDITTQNCHKEIKEWGCWKEALGQLLHYNRVDKKEKLEVYFFGKYSPEAKANAYETLKLYDIVVYEFEDKENMIKIQDYVTKTCNCIYKF